MHFEEALKEVIRQEVDKQLQPVIELLERVEALRRALRGDKETAGFHIGQTVRFKPTAGVGRPARGTVVRLELQNSRVHVQNHRLGVVRCPVGRVFTC